MAESETTYPRADHQRDAGCPRGCATSTQPGRDCASRQPSRFRQRRHSPTTIHRPAPLGGCATGRARRRQSPNRDRRVQRQRGHRGGQARRRVDHRLVGHARGDASLDGRLREPAHASGSRCDGTAQAARRRSPVRLSGLGIPLGLPRHARFVSRRRLPLDLARDPSTGGGRRCRDVRPRVGRARRRGRR